MLSAATQGKAIQPDPCEPTNPEAGLYRKVTAGQPEQYRPCADGVRNGLGVLGGVSRATGAAERERRLASSISAGIAIDKRRKMAVGPQVIPAVTSASVAANARWNRSFAGLAKVKTTRVANDDLANLEPEHPMRK